jgi:nitrate/TMAO reductase-like tetraheme cytochrome c subunit
VALAHPATQILRWSCRLAASSAPTGRQGWRRAAGLRVAWGLLRRSGVQNMPGAGAQSLVVWGLALALFIAALALVGFRHLALARWGQIALLVAAVLLPIATSAGGLRSGVAESSRTRFCLKCHEMQPHGRSLFVDDRQSLAAVHYQNRLIDRDTACYGCHTDYALFGDVRAKLNGLRHVWVHYLGTPPERFTLYQPYPNRNCLRCHEDARRFLDAPAHAPLRQALAAEKTSCLDCHKVAHDLGKAAAGPFWGTP